MWDICPAALEGDNVKGELLRKRRQIWLQGRISSVVSLQYRRVVGILSHDRSRGMAQLGKRAKISALVGFSIVGKTTVTWVPCTVLVLPPVSFPAEAIHV